MSTSDELLAQGIAAYKAGQKGEARRLLGEAVKLDLQNEKAWLWLSGVVESDEEKRKCLAHVLEINPGNQAARKGLEHLGAALPRPEPAIPVAIRKLAPDAPPVTPVPAQPVIVPPPASSPARQSEPERPAVPPAAAGAAVDRRRIDWVVVVGACAIIAILCMAGLFVLMQSRAQQSAQPAPSSGEVTAVIYENVAAHNAEDVTRYIATLHSEGPSYDQTRSVLEQLYGAYDLQTTVRDVELVKLTRNEARVSFVLTTRKVRGPDFRNNEVKGLFILRQEDGRWKIYDQKVEKVDYLD